MWTTGLARWYAQHGRHDLPWRRTQDPWAVLVSEVMLQQTQVSRVLGRWESFLERWPTSDACAAAPLQDVLRFWQGLGYPRRARALHESAAAIAEGGWPRTESGLRQLPGIGRYTARALLTLALGEPSPPPLDVNIRRVAARAALGQDPSNSRRTDMERAIGTARPRALDARAYTFALFDVGALRCRSVPLCSACPLARRCQWRFKGSRPVKRRSNVPRYARSMRQLRGAVLREQLAPDPATTLHELVRRVAGLPLAREPGAVAQAFASLQADRLLDSDWPESPHTAR